MTYLIDNIKQIDEEEGGDQFNMEVTVTEPKKVGDGMNAYMAYRVNTKVGMCVYLYSFVFDIADLMM